MDIKLLTLLMKNIFLQLKPNSTLKQEGLEKIFENQQAGNKQNIMKKLENFFKRQQHDEKQCCSLLLELLALASHGEAKQKLLNLYVYYTSRMNGSDALKNVELILKSEEAIFHKVRFFSHVYKSSLDENLKKWLLTNSIGLMQKESKISLFSSFVQNFDTLISTLTFEKNEYVELYLKLINYLQKHLVYKKLWPKHVVKCLSSVNPNYSKSNQVNQLFFKLIQQNQINQDSVLLLQQTHLKDNLFYPVFEILIYGNYQKFSKINKEFLEKEGINSEELERKVKIQAIPRIVAGISVASYVQVAQILEIKKEEVEDYVIEAIHNGILNAKIDQFQETIIINNVKLRSLRAEEEVKLQKDITNLCIKLDKISQPHPLIS